MSDKFTVFGAEWCSFCMKAKEELNERKIDFEFQDIDTRSGIDKMEEFCHGIPETVPQIFKGNERIGGYSDLMKHLKNAQ